MKYRLNKKEDPLVKFLSDEIELTEIFKQPHWKDYAFHYFLVAIIGTVYFYAFVITMYMIQIIIEG